MCSPDGVGGGWVGRRLVLKVFSQDGFSSVLWSRSSTRTGWFSRSWSSSLAWRCPSFSSSTEWQTRHFRGDSTGAVLGEGGRRARCVRRQVLVETVQKTVEVLQLALIDKVDDVPVVQVVVRVSEQWRCLRFSSSLESWTSSSQQRRVLSAGLWRR